MSPEWTKPPQGGLNQLDPKPMNTNQTDQLYHLAVALGVMTICLYIVCFLLKLLTLL